MVHQQVMVGELLANPGQIVRKAHATVLGRIVSEVVGDGDITGIAPHRDDPRTGEQQLDEADVLEVVGQLVHHMQRPGGVLLQLLEKIARDARDHLGIEIVHTVGIMPTRTDVTLPPLQPGNHAGDQPQLAGAVDLAVAGQHLLDQRGAGARHAQHEHRQRRIIANTTAMLIERPTESMTNARASLPVRRRVIAEQGAAGPIRLVGQCEGPGMVLALFPGGGQLQQQTGLHRPLRAGAAGQHLQVVQGGVILREAPRIDKRTMTAHRVEHLDPFKQRHRLLKTPQLQVQLTQSLQGWHQLRMILQHLAVAHLGLGILLLLYIDPGQRHLRFKHPMSVIHPIDTA
ncbi:hypothetical protein D3C77_262180 [compost metagenome]